MKGPEDQWGRGSGRWETRDRGVEASWSGMLGLWLLEVGQGNEGLVPGTSLPPRKTAHSEPVKCPLHLCRL